MAGGLTHILEGVIRVFSAWNKTICNASVRIASVLLMFMTAIILVQVFYRYVMADSISWSEELTKTMMVWSAFLVAPWALRKSVHVSIDIFSQSFPPKFLKLNKLMLHILILLVLSLFIKEAYLFWQGGANTSAATLPIKMIWFYAIVPFGFFMLFTVTVELLIRDMATLMAPSGKTYDVAPHQDNFEGE